MPSTSAALIDHCGSNVTHLVPIWKLTSRDGLIAAYAAHTRPTVGRLINGAPPFTFGGVPYRIAASQASRDMQKIGLSPNSTQLTGVYDDLIIKEEIEGGRWKLALIVYEYVNVLDLSIGSTSKIAGFAGRWTPMTTTWQVEVMSKSNLIAQQIGEMTSPTDRNTFPATLDKAAWTITRNVASSADRRHFVVDGAALANDYYRYGVANFTSGLNLNYPAMEIRSNVGNAIELQLPMPANIIAGAVVTLLAGYDGTIEQARDKFSNAINFNGEPDMPGLKVVFTYPE